MSNPKTLTPAQAKANFKAKGIKVSDWATEHGYHAHAVYQVLNGLVRANHGTAHEIAVKLGIKPSPDQNAA